MTVDKTQNKYCAQKLPVLI